MASSSAPFSLLPAQPANAAPRKSSLKKPTVQQEVVPAIELKGLALQIAGGPSSPPKILPADEHIKHSLFCDPPTASIERKSLPRHRPRARRASGEPSVSRPIAANLPEEEEEDRLSQLPTNTHFGFASPFEKRSQAHLQRPSVPHNLSIQALPDTGEPLVDDGDKLSPLPEKTQFTPVSPRTSEYPTPLSERSAVTFPSRSDSMSKSKMPTSPEHIQAPPLRSMFPVYDASRPLAQQQYFPRAPVQRLPSEKISKVAAPAERPALQRFDSGLSIADDLGQVPLADEDDLVNVWDASNDIAPRRAKKIRLGFHRTSSNDLLLAIGSTVDRPLYSLGKALPSSPSRRAKQARHLAVEKHSPDGDLPVPIAQLVLPENAADMDSLGIFPQAAAINAIEQVSSSPAAAEIATFDPMARSPEAARLGQDAVAEAQSRYGCRLSRRTKKRDSLGAFTAEHSLGHPALGAMTITVAHPGNSFPSQAQRCKISLHHPTATPAAVAAETLVMASLDMSHGACVIDVPGLLALNCRYLIDTVMAALLAVAALEVSKGSTPTEATLTFAPPPRSPLAVEKKGRNKRSSPGVEKRKWYKRSSKAISQVQNELIGQPADVGAPVQAAVALLGFTLKSAVFVLEAGIKMGTGAVKHVAARA